MTRLLVLYYGSYGHVETLACAIEEGARRVDSVEAVVKRVPELVPDEVARKSGDHHMSVVTTDPRAPVQEAHLDVFPTIRHFLTQVLVGHTAHHVGQVVPYRENSVQVWQEFL